MKKYLSLLILSCLFLHYRASGANDKDGNSKGIPFHEKTIEMEGRYEIDVDFDGINEDIYVDEFSNIEVFKIDMMVKVINYG